MIFFFFFQAEDGIRDRDVTGVQTCALPILAAGIKEHPLDLLRTGPDRFGNGIQAGKNHFDSGFLILLREAALRCAARVLDFGLSNTTTNAAIPSPRPVKPRPLELVPRTLTESAGMPRRTARRLRISGTCGTSFGDSATTTASRLVTSRPRCAARSRARVTKIALSVPFQEGSVSGNCSPSEPRPAAPRIASAIAWRSASPSE